MKVTDQKTIDRQSTTSSKSTSPQKPRLEARWHKISGEWICKWIVVEQEE